MGKLIGWGFARAPDTRERGLRGYRRAQKEY